MDAEKKRMLFEKIENLHSYLWSSTIFVKSSQSVVDLWNEHLMLRNKIEEITLLQNRESSNVR